MREKDEWRFATMEYGGQCVTTAGTRWTLVWSVQSWDMLEVGMHTCTVTLGHQLIKIKNVSWTSCYGDEHL